MTTSRVPVRGRMAQSSTGGRPTAQLFLIMAGQALFLPARMGRGMASSAARDLEQVGPAMAPRDRSWPACGRCRRPWASNGLPRGRPRSRNGRNPRDPGAGGWPAGPGARRDRRRSRPACRGGSPFWAAIREAISVWQARHLAGPILPGAIWQAEQSASPGLEAWDALSGPGISWAAPDWPAAGTRVSARDDSPGRRTGR